MREDREFGRKDASSEGKMVAFTSPLSLHGFTATLAVTYHRVKVACISITSLIRSWNMMEHNGLCDVILDSLSLRVFSDSHARDLMKSHCPLSFLPSSFARLLAKEFSCRRRKSSR